MSKLELTINGSSIEVGSTPKLKKEKTALIVCNIDNELIEFQNEKELKKFMWSNRPNKVLRYNLVGETIVPFDLDIIPVK